MKHVSSLDGVRGIAVIMVMLFHSHTPGASLGWAGVPLFFCLSGFLITSILKEDNKKSFFEYMKKFLINRSLRIFPLFYLYLIVNFFALKATGSSTDGYWWFIVYLQNYFIGFNIFTPGILGHTWSLAIEEQFYWIWPLVIFFIRSSRAVYFFISLVIISLVSRYVIFHVSGGNPYMTNVTLISCVDMLVLGAIFGYLKDSKRTLSIAFFTFTAGVLITAYGVITIGLDNFWTPETWVGHGLYLFTSLGMTFSSLIWFLYNAGNKKNILSNFFNTSFLRFTGKISYGLYMWHLLCFAVIGKIFSFIHVSQTGAIYIASSLVLSYMVSIASFYLYERAFLKLKINPADQETTVTVKQTA